MVGFRRESSPEGDANPALVTKNQADKLTAGLATKRTASVASTSPSKKTKYQDLNNSDGDDGLSPQSMASPVALASLMGLRGGSGARRFRPGMTREEIARMAREHVEEEEKTYNRAPLFQEGESFNFSEYIPNPQTPQPIRSPVPGLPTPNSGRPGSFTTGHNATPTPSSETVRPSTEDQDELDSALNSIYDIIRKDQENMNDDIERSQAEEAERQRLRDLDPSPTPTPSESTDDEYPPEDQWHIDQVRLNLVLNDRNRWGLMPSTWRMSLRGIPLPEGLFYEKTKEVASRPRIYGRVARFEYRGTMALRRLIDIHGRVRDLRERQTEIRHDRNLPADEKHALEQAIISDISRQIRKTLDEALNWAKLDGGFSKYGAQLPDNITVIDLTSAQLATGDMQQVIQRQMNNLADRWDQALNPPTPPGSDEGTDSESHEGAGEKNRPRGPVIFGFVVYRHALFIVTMDTGIELSVVDIPIQINMEEKNQQQWNALAIMVTICWARDIRMRMAQEMGLETVDEATLSDPDA